MGEGKGRVAGHGEGKGEPMKTSLVGFHHAVSSVLLWQSLLDSDAKITVLPDCHTPGVTFDHKLQWLQRIAGHELPLLSQREVSFMIMALAAGYMKPQKVILDAAQQLPMVPTLMAHIRRSDKAIDVRKCLVDEGAGVLFCVLTAMIMTDLCVSIRMFHSHTL